METVFGMVCSGCLQLEVGSGSWEFVFYQDGRTWQGNLAQKDIETNACELRQTVEEYSEVVKRLFSNSNKNKLNDADFSKEFESEAKFLESGCVELSWKKVTSAVKYSLGSVTLVECDSSQVDGIMKNAFGAISKLWQDLEDQKSTNARLKLDNKRLSDRLDDFACKKTDLEGELYTKFALVLNEKKAKIRALQQKKNTHDALQKSVDETQNEEDFCEEMASTPPKTKRERKKKGKPQVKITLSDDSLGDAEDFITKIPKRENRKRAFGYDRPSTSGIQQKQVASKFEKIDDGDNTDMAYCSPELDETVAASKMLDDL